MENRNLREREKGNDLKRRWNWERAWARTWQSLF